MNQWLHRQSWIHGDNIPAYETGITPRAARRIPVLARITCCSSLELSRSWPPQLAASHVSGPILFPVLRTAQSLLSADERQTAGSFFPFSPGFRKKQSGSIHCSYRRIRIWSRWYCHGRSKLIQLESSQLAASDSGLFRQMQIANRQYRPNLESLLSPAMAQS
jgi:hypothetical protein